MATDLPRPDGVTDLYLRISDDKTGEELGVERQRERGHQLREARGWPMGMEHVDNDKSAADASKPRPGFEAMLVRVEAGLVKRIIAHRMDRLLRNRQEQVRLFEAAEKHKIVLSFIDGSDLDMGTTMGQMIADFLAGQARAEIKIKGQRQSDAYQQAAEMGKPAPGPVPFGFMPDRITHHPEQAAAIRLGYDILLAGGTLAAVARLWNSSGLLSGRIRTGKKRTGEPSEWSEPSVRALLLKARNAGLRPVERQACGCRMG